VHFSTSLILRQLQLSAEKIIWTIDFSFQDQKQAKREKNKIGKNSSADSLLLAAASHSNKVKKKNKHNNHTTQS